MEQELYGEKKVFKEYFTSKPIMSKGALFNLVTSDRSDGKTFDIKLNALADYYHTRDINVVCRRFKTEMDEEFYGNFFGEVFNKKNEEIKGLENVGLTIEDIDVMRNWKFTYSKQRVKVDTGDGKKDLIIIFMPLTMAGKKKSVFNDWYQRIHKIHIDEYIPLDGVYLPKEPQKILELWKSVDRDRILDKNQITTQLKCTGNKITPFVPLLDYFNIELSLLNDKVRVYRNGSFAVQVYSSTEHRNKRKDSPFNDLIKGTDYEEYDTGGVLNLFNLKMKARGEKEYWASFKTTKGEGTIWYGNQEFVISNYTRKDGILLVDKQYGTQREEINIKFGLFGKTLKHAYYTNKLYFENERTFYIFEDLLKKC